MRRRVVTEIGFDSDVSSQFVQWTDISSDVSSISATRGRSRELDAIETGECTYILDNEDGRYTPGRGTGYGLKIKPRKPIRSYTMVDDNLCHFECVNPGTYDLDKARFALGGVTLNAVTVSGTSSWEVVPTAFDLDKFAYVGGSYDSDQITVKTGDVIRVSASAMSTVSDTRAGIGVAFFTNANPGSAFAYSGYVYTTGSSFTNLTTTYTVPQDGTVRMVLWSRRTAGGTGVARYRNLKMSFNSTDADYSQQIAHTASGMYPVFRGFVDTWDVDSDGFTTEVTVKAVDWLGVASRPLSSYLRAKFKKLYQSLTAVTAWNTVTFWPCGESSDDVQAAPDLGTVPLKIIKSTPPPATASFGQTSIIPYHDGSGTGWTEDDSNLAKGAVLSLVDRTYPVLDFPVNASGLTRVGTSFWFKGKPPSAGRSCLWWMAAPSGTRMVGLYWESNGTMTIEITGNGVFSDSTFNNGTLAADELAHFTILLEFNPATGSAVAQWQKNYGSASGAGLMTWDSKPLAPGYVQWGGRIVGSTQADFCRGTFSNITWVTGDRAQTSGQDMYTAGNSSFAFDESTLASEILDFAAFPGYRRLDAGLSAVLPPSWDSGADANGLLADTAGDGDAALFVGPEGAVVLHNRSRRFTANPRWNISEWAGALKFSLDSAYVLNQVTAERPNGASRQVKDDTSISAFGVRDRKVRRNVQSLDELYSAAGWLLHKYRESLPRIESLTVDASALNGTASVDADLIGLAHGGTVSDKLQLTGLPASAPADTLSYFVEGVQTSIKVDGSKLDYQVTFSVSDAARSAGFILEDLTYGLLDSDGTVLTY